MGRRALLLVAVLLLVGGPAYARGEHFRDAVRSAVQGMTLDEVIEWSNQKWRKQVTIGRYVRWGGAMVLGSAAVYAALDYFYQALRAQTGTSLDRWYFWVQPVIAGLGQYSYWREGPRCPNPWGCYSYELEYRCNYSYRAAYYAFSRPGGLVAEVHSYFGAWSRDADPCRGVSVETVRAWAKMHIQTVIPSTYKPVTFVPPIQELTPGVPEGARNRYTSDLSWLQDVAVKEEQRPPLPDWLQQHPDATQALRDQVAPTYIDNVWNTSTPFSPVPGIQFEPAPNPNQWTDNPFTRPDIDTDGDGVPDSVEWEEANRRGVPWPDLINNPNAYPDPKADPDGDGWTTEEEISLGTDPYDPASAPARRARPLPRTDTDGDGWPDEEEIKQGTDPRDPNSRPPGTPPLQDTDGDGVPDVEEIKRGTDPTNPQDKPEQKEDEWPGGPPPGELRPVDLPEVPTEEKKDLPQDLVQRLGRQWSEQVVQRVEERMRQLQETARQRFPFALVSALRVNISEGSASCSWTLPIGPFTGQVDLCNTPFWQAATAFRPILAGLVWIGVALAVIRRGLDVQK